MRNTDNRPRLGESQSCPRLIQAMSEEQLKAFMEAVKVDAGLQEKLKAAADTDAVLAITKEAGFDVNKAELLKYQDSDELSDEDVEGVAGGRGGLTLMKACDQGCGLTNWIG